MTTAVDDTRKWWTLGALTFSLFVIMIDNTVVTLALPAMQLDLGLDLTELEWIVNAYTLTFAVLLLVGGKLADFLGRRRIFVAGLVIFTLSSLWCALSSSGDMLIAARAAQGIGAAFMLPSTLSIISATFPPEERGTAIGIWAGVSGGALAIGPLVGGLLVETINWRWIFYINLPFGVIGVLSAYVFVRESRDTSSDQRLDVPGLLASAAAVFGITFGVIEGNNYGWDSATIVGSLAGGAIALGVLILLELRQRLPMLDLSLFRNATFSGANVAGALNFTALFGFIVFISIYLQNVLGYSPVRAGATFLASTVAIMLGAPIAGKLADRIGARTPTTVGLFLFGFGLLLLSRAEADWGFWDMFPWMAIGGFGFGLVLPPATAAILESVPNEKAGVASGVLQSLRQLGGGLGVAVTGAVMASHLGELSPRDPGFTESFIVGLEDVLLVCAAVAFGGGVVAALTIRRTVSREPVAPPAAAAAVLLAETPTRALPVPAQHVPVPPLAAPAALVQDGVVASVRTELEPVAERVDELQAVFRGLLRRITADRRERIEDLELMIELMTQGWRGVDRRLGRIEKTLARIDEEQRASENRRQNPRRVTRFDRSSQGEAFDAPPPPSERTPVFDPDGDPQV